MEKTEELTHPSYGLVQFSRRQGSPKLFGSALENHYNYITLSIRRATVMRDETGDRYHGSVSGDIIEVDLSAAQFAELLTTMNVAMGVPCTIRRLNNKHVEPPPDIPTQTEHISQGFRKRVRDFVTKTAKGAEAVRETVKKKSLNNADREQILSFIDRVTTELSSNVPFLLEMFKEATEKVVTSAKAEIEGYMMNTLANAGLATLQGGTAMPALMAGTNANEDCPKCPEARANGIACECGKPRAWSE